MMLTFERVLCYVCGLWPYMAHFNAIYTISTMQTQVLWNTHTTQQGPRSSWRGFRSHRAGVTSQKTGSGTHHYGFYCRQRSVIPLLTESHLVCKAVYVIHAGTVQRVDPPLFKGYMSHVWLYFFLHFTSYMHSEEILYTHMCTFLKGTYNDKAEFWGRKLMTHTYTNMQINTYVE